MGTIDMKLKSDACGGELSQTCLCLVAPRNKSSKIVSIEIRNEANFMRALRPTEAETTNQAQVRARATRRCFLRGSEVAAIVGKGGRRGER